AAEGSMRDAQSIFDQAIAHSSGKVTAETVRDMLGLADRARIIDLFEMLMKGDVAGALGEFREQYDAGADPATLLTELAEFNHLVTRMRFVPAAADDASLSQDERTRGLEMSAALSVRVLSRTWQMLLKGISEVQSANRPVNAAEMVLIRLAHAASLPTLDDALRMLESGDAPAPAGRRSNGGQAPAGPSTTAVGTSFVPSSGGSGGQTMRLVTSQPGPEAQPVPVVPQPEPEPEAGPRINSIADIIALADANRDMRLKVMLKQYVRPVRIENGKLEVALTGDAPKTLLNDLSTQLQHWTGRRWVVSLSREEGGSTLAEIEAAKRESAFLDA